MVACVCGLSYSRLRWEDHLSPGGWGCSEPGSHHSTPAWVTEWDPVSQKKKKIQFLDILAIITFSIIFIEISSQYVISHDFPDNWHIIMYQKIFLNFHHTCQKLFDKLFVKWNRVSIHKVASKNIDLFTVPQIIVGKLRPQRPPRYVWLWLDLWETNSLIQTQRMDSETRRAAKVRLLMTVLQDRVSDGQLHPAQLQQTIYPLVRRSLPRPLIGWALWGHSLPGRGLLVVGHGL